MIKFFHNGQEIEKIDFDITEVGTSNVLTLGIKNEYSHRIRILYPQSSDPEVKIISIPEALNPQEQQEMTITFEPSIFRRTPLELSNIGFRVVM